MRILIDVDGVVCDFVSGYLSLVRRAGRAENFTLADVTDWNFKSLGLSDECRAEVLRLLYQPGFVHSLATLPGTYEGIAALRKAGHEIVFVTSPWIGHPTWSHERYQWIQARWPSAPVVSTSSKHYVLGDALIDDKPEHVHAWLSAYPGGRGLLWDAPYNAGDRRSVRVRTWDDVARELRS